ncbi:MAG: VOC family protein [Leptospirales bacterium]|jgi:catechol 2,3-dioxygenase-like lactoylglutathione lyase family enzyme
MMLLEGLHHISFGSSDLKASIEFYQDLLGLELLEESEQYALLAQDPVTIRLNLMPGFKSKITNPGELSLSFILDVDDFTNALQELEEKEIEILTGPVGIESGESLLIADPDGNLIELFYRE